jgi:peptide/nickel transport system substrate-binding protein
LAKSFSHPNATTWVYQIRPGVKFHSGATLTPADVVFSLERAADGKAGSVLAGSFANVKSITATGAHAVTVRLSRPDALFNESMSVYGGIVENAAYVKAKGTSYGSPEGGVDCTGPYSIKQWQKGSEIDLQAFPGYWDAALKPKAAQVQLKFLQDPAARATALRTGTVDGAYYISPSGTQSLADVDSGKLSYGANPTVRSLMVFHLGDGPLKDPRLRQAISLALDRSAVIKAAFGGVGRPAAAPVSRDAFGYEKATFQAGLDALPPVDKPDIAQAKKLVSEAGKPSRPIVVASSNSDPSYDLTALAIQSAGQQIGLDIKIRRLPIQQYNALFADESQRKGIDLFQTTWNLDYADPLEFYGLFAQPGAYNNFVDFKDPAYTALANRAISAQSDAERAKLTVELQASFMKQLPWIPMFEIPNTVFLNKRLGGAPTSSAYLSYPWAATVGAAG